MTRPAPQTTVAAVIPTAMRRPHELERAVASALAQTLPLHEVVVVVDAPDAPLPTFADERVRVLRNTGRRGPGAARNTGVRTASSELIALLDDDDHWLPDKIELQTRVYRDSPADSVIVSRVRIEGPDSHRFAPDRPHLAHEPLADYLFPRPSAFTSHDHTVATPTILTSRRLLLAEPFAEDLARWEDYEWLLRVTDCGHALRWVGSPQAVIDQTRASGPGLSLSVSPELDLAWADTYLAPRSTRALHHHRLTYAAPGFARQGRRGQALSLILDAVRQRQAPPALLAKAVLTSTVPYPWVAALRRRLTR